MAKGRANAQWKHGLRAGWTEFRYGTDDTRPISLAGPKPHPIFRGEKRQHAINIAMDVLRDWRQSPFEREGPTRAGIRSAFCLQGYGWPRSDVQAGEIVGEALRMLGAKRPTWEQGQRHYVEPRENCRWCSVELDTAGRVAGFCSVEHARAALTHWGFETRNNADAAFRAVYRATRRLAQKPRKCIECGRKFRPQREGSDQRCCSTSCVNMHRRKERPERACAHCGAVFHLERNNLDARFCSKRCAYDHRSASEFSRTCTCCGISFTTASPKATYCSITCTQVVSKIKHGRPPKRISPPVFDYVFRMAAELR